MPSSVPFLSSTGFLLSQLGVVATRAWTQVLVERTLTPNQHAVLLTLRAAGPLTMTALADATLNDPRNMSPILDPLEQRGLIGRSTSRTDRRVRLVALTEGGAEAADELGAATSAIENDLLGPLRGAERDALRGYLLSLWRHAAEET